jgi:hypothetical protein
MIEYIKIYIVNLFGNRRSWTLQVIPEFRSTLPAIEETKISLASSENRDAVAE